MNWDYGTLPPCDTYESEHQVGFPFVGANCNDQKKGLSQLRGPAPEEKEGDKMPDWNSWDPNTLPLCKHWRNAHEVKYPYVGANCVDSRSPPPAAPNSLNFP